MSLQLLVVYGISYFFLAVFMLVFITRRYSLRVTAAVLAATYLLVFLLEFTRYQLSRMGYTWRFTMVIAVFVSMSGALAASKYRDGRTIFTVFLGGSYIMFGDMTAKLLLSVNAAPAVVFAGEILCHVLLLFLMIRFLLPPYQRLQQVYRAEWSQFTMVLVMFYGGTYLLFDCLKHPDVTAFHFMMPLAYLFTIYLLMTLMFQMLGRMNLKEVEEREQKVLSACMGALKMEVSELRRAERRIVEYNHDSRHFVRMLRGMMAEKDYQGVEQALAEMREMPEMTNRNRYCKNVPLNGVAAYYVHIAEEEQIRMTIGLETLPEDLGENDWELATVLGNILENAVWAVKMVEAPERRRLHIRGYQRGDQTMFEIRNIFSDTAEFDGNVDFLTGESGSGRGLGMRSMIGFVNQWNGTLDCGVDGEWFYVRILI